MKYAIDTEFIDTPTCSALISLAIVAEDGGELYFEFDYPKEELTPWLRENVVPHLRNSNERWKIWDTKENAVQRILEFVSNYPEWWCYYGAYDWYFFCRLFGGFMSMPSDRHWPILYNDLAHFQGEVPNVAGAEHNALNDARSLMAALKAIKDIEIKISR